MSFFDHQFPFRVGTTSYIIPDDILPNARYLAERVRDVELVLFELDDGQNNLPSPSVLDELRALSRDYDVTYTVHLPLDLRLGADGDERHESLIKARRVIETTRVLDPWAYVLHLDGKEHRQDPQAEALRRWQDQSVRALELVAGWAGSFELLAVENLDSYPPEFNDPVLERVPASRCIDVGHLWKDGHDPLPYLERWISRARVLHLHGVAERDHQTLAHTSPEQLDPVLKFLVDRRYNGVVTLEIFGEEDFHSSVRVMTESAVRQNLAASDGAKYG